MHCAICGEESGGRGTSMWGSVHKYGPTDHPFTPQEEPPTKTVYVMTENDDYDAPPYTSVHLSLAGAMLRAEAIRDTAIAQSEWNETVEGSYWVNEAHGLRIERLRVED